MNKWLKAMPFFLNGAFYFALGIFTIVGTVPAVFSMVVASVGFLVNAWLGVRWNPPEAPVE